MTVLRLRSTDASGLARKAEVVASRLMDLAVEGLTPGQVAVERVDGQWSVTGAGQLIITADAATATASGMDAKSLCESWRVRLADVLREPYLCVRPHDLLIVPFNESRVIRFGGTIRAQPVLESMARGVARIEVQAGRAVVHGVGVGTTVVILQLGTVDTAITIDVRKWAARIAGNAVLEPLPGGIPEPMTQTALRNAALTAVQPEPRATVQLTELTQTGQGYSAWVRAGGAEYLPVSRALTIGVRRGTPAIPRMHRLLISNYPERVVGTGALLRQRLGAGVPSRLMWHHKNYAGRPLTLSIRLVNAGTQPACVRTGWAQAGPDPDEIFVGYNAMLRYWESVRRGAGFVVTVPAGSSFETVAMRMGHHDVVSGLMDMIVDAGENVYLEVSARSPEDVPGGFCAVDGTELATTPYEFPAILEAEVEYEVGGRFGHLSIGREDLENDHGFALAGAYGVSHLVRVNASNPTPNAATLELALRAGGGVARAVTLVDGSINTSGILSATHEQLLERRPLAPGARVTVPLEIIPTAGSNLPFTLIVRSSAR
ncbi:MAG: hypothetical protein ACOX9R_18225 [Armatimonadota bacterium]